MSSHEHAETVAGMFFDCDCRVSTSDHAADYRAHLDAAEASLAALVSVAEKAEALAEAARELLGDDDMPNHWDDCVCSYCTRSRALRAALAAFRSGATDEA